MDVMECSFSGLEDLQTLGKHDSVQTEHVLLSAARSLS